MQVVMVGGEVYGFAINQEANCELLRIPGNEYDAAEEVAIVKQKLVYKVRKAHGAMLIITLADAGSQPMIYS